MISKRMAILAVFSGVIAKMAHADDPNWKAVPDNATSLSLWSGPVVWTANLNQMKQLDVMFDGQTVTITPAEIIAALKPLPNGRSETCKSEQANNAASI